MCGIVGEVKFRGRIENNEHLSVMAKTIKHRGPDDSGFFVDGRVGFGHRRLSIIDLSRLGHQPMANEDKTIWLIFNGEIYNYLELKKELSVKHSFYSQTDSEVIIHAYEEWGESGFSRFNGEWAFAIYDQKRQRVILSRDRFSIKPLYYVRNGDVFYFASEIKAIIPFLKDYRPNLETLYRFIKQSLVDSDENTFFFGIKKVRPRHNLIIDLKSGTIEERPYWDYSLERLPENDFETRERFLHLLKDSIRLRLRSDVPLACLLSGGLDSSSIAVIANQLSDNVGNFSAVFKESKFSEEKFIDLLSEKSGLKLKKLIFSPEPIWDDLEKVVYNQDEPFGGLSAVIHYQLISKIKQETGVKVLLSGQGGDEIMAGYRKYFFFYLLDCLRNGKWSELLGNSIGSLVNGTILHQFSLSESKRYLPFFNKNRKDPLDGILNYQAELEPLWLARGLREKQILDIERYSVPALAHYEDRNSMANSLEIRLPFLDYRLVNFALSLPDNFKVRNGWNKYILRKSLTELPAEIAWRKDKQGFLSPEKEWLKNNYKKEILNLLKKSRLEKIGLIRKGDSLRFYNRFLRGYPDVWYADVSRILIAEIWLDKFFN